ncbi:MAG TPA: hypothetical protein P5154_07740 [Candidatus Izemoplasmatales bacterium]|nr:hypothetical protein [Candidatus Izemoplasmatales bacterium]
MTLEDPKKSDHHRLGDEAFHRLESGKVLLREGRAAEALEAFEHAICPEDPPSDDPVRTEAWVWRELALCRFGDIRSPHRLLEWAAKSSEIKTAATARALALGCAWLLSVPLPEETLLACLRDIDPNRTPSQAACARCAADLLSGRPDRLGEIIALILPCQQIEGEAELLWTYRDRFATAIDAHPQGDEFRRWIHLYADPIRQARETFDQTVFPHLSGEPRLRSVNCARCDGRCCYDGVYITYEEEDRIRAFRNRYPEGFKHVPEIFTEEGEWGFLFHGRRTLRVPHGFDRPDFPSHFSQTKCVFALPNGECSLQKTATEHGYHPWAFKPASCWQFPLIGLFNENAWERPHYFGVPDPGYCDEDHPGYVSFMPCAVVDSQGVSWKTAYRNELQYFLHQKNHKND